MGGMDGYWWGMGEGMGRVHWVMEEDRECYGAHGGYGGYGCMGVLRNAAGMGSMGGHTPLMFAKMLY